MANDYASELEALERVLQLGVQYGATRVCVAGIEVTLDPKAPATPSSDKGVTLPASPEPRCRCGHSFEEHSEAGCFHGCRLSTCAAESEE